MTLKTLYVPGRKRLLEEKKMDSVQEAKALQQETQGVEATESTEAAMLQRASEGAEAAESTEATTLQRETQGAVARRPSIWKELLFLLFKVASIVLLFLLMVTFLFGIVRYQEPSMAPAIKNGDLVIFYRNPTAVYLPQDVIVLEYEGSQHARRVVASAGDTVDITDAGLLVNGALQQEPEIFQKTERYQEGVSFPLTVPEGQIFVLGDSREGAEDSRIYGCVKTDDTLGKVITVIRRRGI